MLRSLLRPTSPEPPRSRAQLLGTLGDLEADVAFTRTIPGHVLYFQDLRADAVRLQLPDMAARLKLLAEALREGRHEEAEAIAARLEREARRAAALDRESH